MSFAFVLALKAHQTVLDSYHRASGFDIRMQNFRHFCIGMERNQKCFLLVAAASSFLLPLVHCIVGGRLAAVPPYDDPVVFVNHVGRFSRVEGYQNPSTGLYTFRGIKYADPPVRENRFLRPHLKRLSGDVDARRNAPPCPQPDYYGELCKWLLQPQNKMFNDPR